MASYKTAFGSFLKHEDLQGKEARVVITSVTQEDVKNGDNGVEKKLVARFAGKDKAMILNLTNCEALSHIAGTDDYDEWAGTAVVLFTDTNVKFGGKTVSGLRLKAPATKQAAPPPPAREPGEDDIDSSDIGFAWLLPILLPALSAGLAVVA